MPASRYACACDCSNSPGLHSPGILGPHSAMTRAPMERRWWPAMTMRWLSILATPT